MPLASAGTTCQATPLGHLCAYDAQNDGAPERVYLDDPSGDDVVVLDAWHRPGFDAFATGANVPLPGFGLESARVALAGYDSNSDSWRERFDFRADAMSWSNVGGWVAIRYVDADSDGVPEHLDVSWFTTKTGFESERIATGLS